MKTLFLALGIALAAPFSVHAQSLDSKAMVSKYLDEGRTELRRGRTVAGEMAYRKAIAFDPSDPLPHYLLANMLARSDRHVDAISEYKLALRLEPGGSVAGYCKQALAAYKLTSFSELANPTSVEYVPPPPPSQLETAIDKIDRQAQTEKARDAKFANNLSTSAVKAGAWKAADIKLTAESDIANGLYMLPKSGSSRSRRYSGVDPAQQELARIRADADRRAALEEEMAKERADSHATWARERQMEIDDVAGNLKEQLTERPSKFGFDLAPTGTGLYVRNYKSSVPKKKLPDPRFSVLRLTEPGIHDGD